MPVKNPVKSKIHIAQIITIGVSCASIWGLIPEENKVMVLETVTLVGPVATMVLRQWFTGTRLAWSEGDDDE
jgi:hypothetical protein